MQFRTACALLLAVATPCAAGDDLSLADEQAALLADDTCIADPAGHECAIQLLQLRGAPVAVASEDADVANGTDAEGGSRAESVFAASDFCCTKGASTNACGTCFPGARAQAGSYCGHENNCGDCGGTWCTMGCVFASSDRNDMCGTAFVSSIAREGSFCAGSRGKCGDCGGAWCPTAAAGSARKDTTDKIFEEEPGSVNLFAQVGEAESPVAASMNASSDFCCTKGASTSTCGTCFPGARAQDGSYCGQENNCGDCGGTWCTMRCVFASSDPNDMCGTAFASSIAKDDSFCAGSEGKCGDCGGTWCPTDAAGSASEDTTDEIFEEDPGSANLFAQIGEAESIAAASRNASRGGETDFCCTKGASTNTCGTCFPGARAQDGSYCGQESNCGDCGGTWCTMRCVFSSSDSNDMCGTAFASSIATEDSFCATSEDKCGDCGGTWCPTDA